MEKNKDVALFAEKLPEFVNIFITLSTCFDGHIVLLLDKMLPLAGNLRQSTTRLGKFTSISDLVNTLNDMEEIVKKLKDSVKLRKSKLQDVNNLVEDCVKDCQFSIKSGSDTENLKLVSIKKLKDHLLSLNNEVVIQCDRLFSVIESISHCASFSDSHNKNYYQLHDLFVSANKHAKNTNTTASRFLHSFEYAGDYLNSCL